MKRHVGLLLRVLFGVVWSRGLRELRAARNPVSKCQRYHRYSKHEWEQSHPHKPQGVGFLFEIEIPSGRVTEAITAIDPNSRCFTVVKSQGQGRNPESDRAADRHQHGGRQVLPRMLGVFAEFETNLRRERQLEGIAKAKAAGVYKGRKPSIDQAQVEKLKAEGLGATEIAKRLNIGRAAVIRHCPPFALEGHFVHQPIDREIIYATAVWRNDFRVCVV